MSISSEITRISQNVSDSLTAVASKGATVPSGANSDDLPDLIASLPSTHSVTYNLTSGVSASVTPSKAVAGQGFSLKLKALAGYSLSGVTVTMGGVDITDQVFEYDETGGGGGGSITIEEVPNATGTTLQITTNGSGSGGTPSATQHDIYFEFADETNTTITAYWDDSFISNAITATTPTTYGNKTVTLAQLDGVTWYEPTQIPIGVELIDFTKVSSDTIINDQGQAQSEQWYYASDYTSVASGMTFSYTGATWYYIGVYDSSKNFLRAIYINDDGQPDPEWNSRSFGTLSGSELTDAAYVRITGLSNTSSNLSLIRTA